MCDDPKEGGAARGVSRVGYVGAHARFVRRAVPVPLRKSSFLPRRSIARAFSALPDGRRVVVAVPPPAWKWGVAVGVRWAVAMAMAVGVRGSVGRHRPRGHRAPTSHPRIVRPCHGGT